MTRLLLTVLLLQTL